jgi:hypothetical protein
MFNTHYRAHEYIERDVQHTLSCTWIKRDVQHALQGTRHINLAPFLRTVTGLGSFWVCLEGGSRPELQRSMKKELSAWLSGNGHPHRFLRAWLPAVASGDFSGKMTLGGAAGVKSNTFFFGPSWFGASPKHGPCTTWTRLWPGPLGVANTPNLSPDCHHITGLVLDCWSSTPATRAGSLLVHACGHF